MVELLKLMGLESSVKNEKTLTVQADAIRSDILHPCDLAEDIAIAHNYNNSKYT
jgi:phenylalanyl-tRNA synthetase beta chain